MKPSPRPAAPPAVLDALLDEELLAPLGKVVEDLELTLRGPLKWEAGALLTAARTLERASARLADVESRLQGRLGYLRQAQAYLTRKAEALRAAGRAAIPPDDHREV